MLAPCPTSTDVKLISRGGELLWFLHHSELTGVLLVLTRDR